MITLALTACLVHTPAICQDVNLYYTHAGANLMQCYMSAPLDIGKWLSEHENWRIASFKCLTRPETSG